MSTSCAKSPQGRRLVRKSVPDGSCDFQRALDHFLSSSESDESGDYNENNHENSVDKRVTEDRDKKSSKYKYIVTNEDGLEQQSGELDNFEYDDDFEDCEEDTNADNGSKKSSRVNRKGKNIHTLDTGKLSPRNNDHNNNNARKSVCTCGLDQISVTITYEDFDTARFSQKNAWGISNKDVLLSTRKTSNSSLEDNYTECVEYKDSAPLKLPSITAHLHSQTAFTPLSGMGINCSANIEDAEQFSSILSNIKTTPKEHNNLTRMGGIVSKGSDPFDKQNHALGSSGTEHCSCDHQEEGKKGTGQTIKTTFNCSSQKSSAAKDCLTNTTKRSSSLPGRSSSKTATSPPQRLLTSRNRSPNGYLRSGGSMDVGGDMRARSHSWSNGRSISQPRQGPVRPITKNSSLYPRTLVLGPSGARSPHTLRQQETTGVKKSPSPSSTQPDNKIGNTSPGLVIHLPGCPLFVPTDTSSDSKKKVTVATLATPDSPDGNIESDLSPVQRPRAASESHSKKIRPHQHLLDLPRPRSNTMSEGSSRGLSPSSEPDHGVHVHWADEEHGLSLSTSVLLTSIRPRSYSHGAVEGRPHRPILKKVAGL